MVIDQFDGPGGIAARIASAIAACSSQSASRWRDCCSTAPMTRRRCTQCRRALALDQRVTGGRVDRVVERDVGLDHRLNVAAARGAPAGLDQRGIEDRVACGREPDGERVERAADLVDVGDPAGVERRDEDAAAGRVEHEAVLLQQPQRLQHRLARDRQAFGDVFLRHRVPGAIEPSLIASSSAR